MITSKQILSGAYDRLIATRIKQQHLNITIEEYRWKWAAAIDPYYWTKRVLNYTKLQLYPHVEMCRSMREDCKKYKRILRIQPRGIFKTTIYVISQCLDILRCQPDASIMIFFLKLKLEIWQEKKPRSQNHQNPHRQPIVLVGKVMNQICQ